MSVAVEHLREIHLDLTSAVDQAEEAFRPAVEAAFSDERCPAQDELRAILGVTHRIASRLADFLEGIETAFSKAPESILQLLDELEPLRSDDDVEVPPPPAEWYDKDNGMPPELKEAHWETIQKIHPCRPKGDSAIGRIPGVYGTSNAINNQLYKRKIGKSHVWRETHELWVKFTYFGGMTASGGLANRIQHMGELFRDRGDKNKARQSLVQRLLSLFKAKSERTTSGESPWKDAVRELRRIASRASWLAEADVEQLDADAIRTWCFVMDDWLKGLEEGKDLKAGESILMGLVDEAPVAEATVHDRLRRLHRLFESAELRSKIETRLGDESRDS
jgi:hypothetical protein